MNVAARISLAQLASTIAVFGSIAHLMFIPTGLVGTAGPDGWLAPVVSALIAGIPIVLLLAGLARFHPQRSLGEIAELCLGKWGGKLVALVTWAFSVFLGSLVVRDIMDFVTTAVLPGTPLLITGLLFVATASYAALGGGEVIARLAVLSLVVILGSHIFVVLGLVDQMEPIRLRPFLGRGLRPVLQASYPAIGWVGELWLFGWWLGLTDRPRKVGSGLLWGVGLATWVLSITTALIIASFGIDLVPKMLLPSYYLVHLVRIGEFLERTEVVLIGSFVLGMTIKAAVCLWVAATCAARVLGVQKLTWLVPVHGGIALGLTQIWPGFIDLVVWSMHYPTPITIAVVYPLLTLLLLISWWKARRRAVAAS